MAEVGSDGLSHGTCTEQNGGGLESTEEPIYAAFLDTVREAAEHRQERRDREDRHTRLVMRVSLVLLVIGVLLSILSLTLWLVIHASGGPSDQQQGSVASICAGHPDGAGRCGQ